MYHAFAAFLWLCAFACDSFGRPAPRAPSIAHPPRPRARVVVPSNTSSNAASRFKILAVEPSGAPAVSAPKANPFAGLTEAEATSVVQYLHSQAEINLTSTPDSGV